MSSYSVLMSVYSKEEPAFFKEPIQSMLNQTQRTDDFVIVCDGPLTEELDDVLRQYQRMYPDIFQIIRLSQNVGIGAAMNAGLQMCKNDLVAKMDADDIAIPSRCELQIERFLENPQLTILGGFIAEFDSDAEHPFSIRSVPESNESIRTFAKRRQPFNNVTVMYRKAAVIAVGGYSNLLRNEDYDLYIRLLANGYYAENLPIILVNARVDEATRRHRASKDTLIGCVQSRWRAFRSGYSSFRDFLFCVAGQFAICISPGIVQEKIYSKYLRSPTRDDLET